jgi:hypothetical protein
MEIKIFENRLIAFDFDNNMINATDMLKNYPNKRMNDFLIRKDVKAFIEVLESKTGIPVLNKKHGGHGHGTWMHKLLAYKFASYLDPKFEVFVYMAFDEFINSKFRNQQRQLDYFWDREDIRDLY